MKEPRHEDAVGTDRFSTKAGVNCRSVILWGVRHRTNVLTIPFTMGGVVNLTTRLQRTSLHDDFIVNQTTLGATDVSEYLDGKLSAHTIGSLLGIGDGGGRHPPDQLGENYDSPPAHGYALRFIVRLSSSASQRSHRLVPSSPYT